jgi:hypothetical protein
MASVVIPYPSCGKELRFRDRSLLGRRGKCPECDYHFVLEEPAEVELELVDPAPAVEGPSDRGEPKDQPMPVATVPFSDFTVIGDIGCDTASGEAGRLREIKCKNVKRRNPGFAAGAVLVAVLAGVFFVVQGNDSNIDRNAVEKRSQPLVAARARQSEEQAGRSPAEFANGARSTTRAPIKLLYVPTGANIVINVRPAELWRERSSGEEFLRCLGPLAQWAELQLKNVCLYEPRQMEEVLICVILGPRGTPPEVAAVVRLVDEQKKSALLKKFQGERVDDYGRSVYVTAERAYAIIDLKTIAIAPRHMAQQLAQPTAQGGVTVPGIEQLLERTDRHRQLTVMFEPDDARRHQEFLIPERARDFFNHFLDWFGDDVETVACSVHLADTFHCELLLRNRNVITPLRLQRVVRKNLDRLPLHVLEAVKTMNPGTVGQRRIIGRFPAMVKAYAVSTLSDVGDRLVRLSTELPPLAAPNLALGALLTWEESTRTDIGRGKPTSRPTRSKLPARIADRLQMKIEIDFRRTPLQDAFTYLGEETQVQFEIDGDALKLAGYTKNMPQTFNLGTVPATKALHAILNQYDQMVIVLDESQQAVTVTTKAAAAQKGLKPFPLEP